MSGLPRVFRCPVLKSVSARHGHYPHQHLLVAAKLRNSWTQQNQPKFIPRTISPGSTRHSFLARSVKAFILTPKSLALAYSPLVLRCLLRSPAMRSNAGMANRQGDVQLALRTSLRHHPVSTWAWQLRIHSERVFCMLYFKKEAASRRANLSQHSKE